MSDWIADRRPAEDDADPDGNVIARHDGLLQNPCVHYKQVTVHCHWRHTPLWHPPLPTIKVGQKWRRADGVELEVFIDNGLAWPLRIGRTLAEAFWYGRNGKTGFVSDQSMRLVELIQDAPEEIQSPAAEPDSEPKLVTKPRRFVSISRTILKNGDHILDAIDDGGDAWWMRLNTQPHDPAFPPAEPEWQLLTPLRYREVQF